MFGCYIFSDRVHCLCHWLPVAERVSGTPGVQEVVVHSVTLHVYRLWRLVSPNGVDVIQMATPATRVGCVKVLNFSQNFVAFLSQGLKGRSRGVCGKEDFLHSIITKGCLT